MADSGPGPMEKAKRKLEKAAEDIRDVSGENVRVAGRSNIAKSVNIGGNGETHRASSKQTVRIKQDGESEEVYEWTETETN